MSKDDDSVKNTSQNKDQITKLVNNYIYGGQNVIASGDEIHQQVQQQSSLESEGIKEMIDLLKAKLPEIGLSVRDEAQVQAEIQTAEAQMNSPKPRHNVIKEGLQTINRVLEGAAGNAMGGVVAGLLVAKLAPFIH